MFNLLLYMMNTKYWGFPLSVRCERLKELRCNPVSHVLENREALKHTQSQGKALQFKELIPTGSMLSALL